jgi:hypothetical protein
LDESNKRQEPNTHEVMAKAIRPISHIADRVPPLRTVESHPNSDAEPESAPETTPQGLPEGKPGDWKRNSVSLDNRVTNAPRRIQPSKATPRLAGCRAPDRPPRGFPQGGLRPFASPCHPLRHKEFLSPHAGLSIYPCQHAKSVSAGWCLSQLLWDHLGPGI